MATRKYFRRSIQERKRILEKYDQLPPMSQRAAARLLNISGPLLCIWLRKRNVKNGKANFPRTVVPSRKTPRVEAALWRWIDTSRENGVTVDDSTIRRKATLMATEMGLCNFRASAEWLARFKTRETVIRKMSQVDRKTGDAPKEPNSGDDNKAVETKSNLTAKKTHLIEAVLWRWIDDSREKGFITDQMLRSEATRLSRMMGFGNFRASADWLSRFKTREKVVRKVSQLDQCSDNPQRDQTEDRSASDQVIQQSEESMITDQSSDESGALTDLDIPKLDPTVVRAELNGDLHTVTVPSLWQMKEAMKTLATGLLYRGFCDFKLLHQFEKEVNTVLRRSVTLGTQNGSQA